MLEYSLDVLVFHYLKENRIQDLMSYGLDNKKLIEVIKFMGKGKTHYMINSPTIKYSFWTHRYY